MCRLIPYLLLVRLVVDDVEVEWIYSSLMMCFCVHGDFEFVQCTKYTLAYWIIDGFTSVWPVEGVLSDPPSSYTFCWLRWLKVEEKGQTTKEQDWLFKIVNATRP